MSKFQPPPAWALPILVDEVTKKAIFNPIWLKWFIELAANLDSTGAGSGAGNVTGPTSSVAGHFATWGNTSGKLIQDGGAVGSAAHAATTDFLAAAGTAANSNKLLGATWEAPAALVATTPAAVKGTTVKATSAAGFISSDGSTGFTGTVTAASLVGKTLTIKDGIITGFA